MGRLSGSSFRKLIPEGAKVVVGLSGGADSIALLDLLHRQGYHCVSAHCNFHLRGEESNRDFEFAHSQSNARNAPFFSIDFQTEAYADIKRISTEMAARELRYAWFKEVKERVKADYIAVAHHADDCIETFLINLSRGTGLRGLAGIKPIQGDIVRPLLSYTKKEILEYIEENELSYVDDSTNFESVYMRNKFRNNVLPMMEEVNPSFRRNILQTINHLSEAEKFIQNQLMGIKESIMKPNDLDGWTIQKTPIINREDGHFILYELLRPYGFSAQIIEDLIRLGMDGTGKRFYSDQYELRCERSEWEIVPFQKSDTLQYTINSPEDVEFLPIRLRFNKFKAQNLVIKRQANICYADASKIGFPLILRHYKSGDYFVPFGMTGRKKASDFFIDQHYSQFDKDKIWVLTSVNGDIIWLVGKRADNRCRITEKSEWVYEITIE